MNPKLTSIYYAFKKHFTLQQQSHIQLVKQAQVYSIVQYVLHTPLD